MSVRRAILWSYAGTALKFVGQFGVTIAMARLLGPEPYGLLAVAMLPMGLGMMIADAGLGNGLVQKRAVDRALACACMWWQVAISLFLALLVAVIAGPLSMSLHADAALPLMLAATLLFPINATAQISSALLKREMRFKELQLASITGMVLAGAIGLPLAMAGAGPWALVAATIGQAAVNAIVLWHLARPPWAWRRQPWPRSLGRFGASVIGLNLANWAIVNTETVALSRLQGAVVLGAYSRLSVISTGLVNMLLPPLQAVLLAHHARNQDRLELVRRQWLRSVGLCAGAFSAIALPIVAMPDLAIGWTLGVQWASYDQVLRVLCIAMIANAVMSVCGPTLQAVGHPERELKVQAMVAILAVPSLLWAASTQSLVNFAVVVSAIALIRCIGMVIALVSTLWPSFKCDVKCK